MAWYRRKKVRRIETDCQRDEKWSDGCAKRAGLSSSSTTSLLEQLLPLRRGRNGLDKHTKQSKKNLRLLFFQTKRAEKGSAQRMFRLPFLLNLCSSLLLFFWKKTNLLSSLLAICPRVYVHPSPSVHTPQRPTTTVYSVFSFLSSGAEFSRRGRRFVLSLFASLAIPAQFQRRCKTPC